MLIWFWLSYIVFMSCGHADILPRTGHENNIAQPKADISDSVLVLHLTVHCSTVV